MQLYTYIYMIIYLLKVHRIVPGSCFAEMFVEATMLPVCHQTILIRQLCGLSGFAEDIEINTGSLVLVFSGR